MEQEASEFLKLDETDRKVLLWLMDVHPKAIKSWIEFITDDYKRRKGIHIDAVKLLKETHKK